MHFNFHIRVDELQRALSGLHLASTCLNRMGGKGLRAATHLRQAGLVRLEEETVHVGHLHFVIVEEEQL